MPPIRTPLLKKAPPSKTTETDWYPYRSEIEKWYLEDKMSAKSIAERLKSEGKLNVNERQVQLRLQQWKCKKTNTNQGQAQTFNVENMQFLHNPPWDLTNNYSTTNAYQHAQFSTENTATSNLYEQMDIPTNDTITENNN